MAEPTQLEKFLQEHATHVQEFGEDWVLHSLNLEHLTAIRPANGGILKLKTPLGTLDTLALDHYHKARGALSEHGINAALIVNADPRYFSAGANVTELYFQLIKAIRDGDDSFIRAHLEHGQREMIATTQSPVPIGALKLHQASLGGGDELLLSTIARYATEDSTSGTPEARYGFIPGWLHEANFLRIMSDAIKYGITNLRDKDIRELALLLSAHAPDGRLSAGTAEQMGLTLHDKVFPDDIDVGIAVEQAFRDLFNQYNCEARSYTPPMQLTIETSSSFQPLYDRFRKREEKGITPEIAVGLGLYNPGEHSFEDYGKQDIEHFLALVRAQGEKMLAAIQESGIFTTPKAVQRWMSRVDLARHPDHRKLVKAALSMEQYKDLNPPEGYQ